MRNHQSSAPFLPLRAFCGEKTDYRKHAICPGTVGGPWCRRALAKRQREKAAGPSRPLVRLIGAFFHALIRVEARGPAEETRNARQSDGTHQLW
eukprot:1196338-Prorocentrum_minimum.AAC.5